MSLRTSQVFVPVLISDSPRAHVWRARGDTCWTVQLIGRPPIVVRRERLRQALDEAREIDRMRLDPDPR